MSDIMGNMQNTIIDMVVARYKNNNPNIDQTEEQHIKTIAEITLKKKTLPQHNTSPKQLDTLNPKKPHDIKIITKIINSLEAQTQKDVQQLLQTNTTIKQKLQTPVTLPLWTTAIPFLLTIILVITDLIQIIEIVAK